MTISTTSSTTSGSYSITITGAGSAATHTANYTLTVGSGGGSGIANGGFETGDLTGWTVTGTASMAGGGYSGTYSARVGANSSPTNGDSSIAQTFTVPSGYDGLAFWYENICHDSLDWATATLKDNTTGTTSTPLPKVCNVSGRLAQSTASVAAGHSYMLTLVNHDDNDPEDGSYTDYDAVQLWSGIINPVANPGFESGDTFGWTGAGWYAVTTSNPHSGSYAALLGSTSRTNGDSSLSQTFTTPNGSSQLSFWYLVACPDIVTNDWATATLKDNTTGTTTTVLPRSCSNTYIWTRVTATITAGHSYTLALFSHDDYVGGNGTYTEYDDVVVS